MKARPLRRPTRTGRRDTRGARIATRKNPKSERGSRERHQTSLRASARSSLPAGRGPAGRRGTEGSPFCAVRTRNPILKCVAQSGDTVPRPPDTGPCNPSSVTRYLPRANFGLRELPPVAVDPVPSPARVTPVSGQPARPGPRPTLPVSRRPDVRPPDPGMMAPDPDVVGTRNRSPDFHFRYRRSTAHIDDAGRRGWGTGRQQRDDGDEARKEEAFSHGRTIHDESSRGLFQQFPGRSGRVIFRASPLLRSSERTGRGARNSR